MGYDDWRDAVIVYGFMFLTLAGFYRLCTMDIPPVENNRATNLFYSVPVAPVTLNLLVIRNVTKDTLEGRTE